MKKWAFKVPYKYIDGSRLLLKFSLEARNREDAKEKAILYSKDKCPTEPILEKMKQKRV